MMKRSTFSILLIYGLLFSVQSQAAMVQCLVDHNVRFIGKIEAGDFQRVKACKDSLLQSDFTDKPITVSSYSSLRMFVISSPGGVVSEALKIGRFIREQKMIVAVPDYKQCFSSCVYILAAGIVKYPWGDVGIHRPYFESKPSLGYDTTLKAILSESRTYFREMNIPEALADDMFSIPPAEMRLLGDALLTKYRLDQPDMAYAEERAIENAKAYGLSRQEYEFRLKLSEQLAKECRATTVNMNSEERTAMVVRCSDLSRKKAGLILK